MVALFNKHGVPAGRGPIDTRKSLNIRRSQSEASSSTFRTAPGTDRESPWSARDSASQAETRSRFLHPHYWAPTLKKFSQTWDTIGTQ